MLKKMCFFFLSSNMPRTKTPFNDAIVFVVGGGNYIEYQNLLDNAKVIILSHFSDCFLTVNLR